MLLRVAGLSGALGSLPFVQSCFPRFPAHSRPFSRGRASRVFSLLCVACAPPYLILILLNVAISHSLGISFEHIGESYILDEGISDSSSV